MSYEINPSHTFLTEAKRLRKRYHSFVNDLEDFKKSLEENPYQGAELCPGIRKIRMTIGRIALLTIYDKSDASTIQLNVIRQMARELGFEV